MFLDQQLIDVVIRSHLREHGRDRANDPVAPAGLYGQLPHLAISATICCWMESGRGCAASVAKKSRLGEVCRAQCCACQRSPDGSDTHDRSIRCVRSANRKASDKQIHRRGVRIDKECSVSLQLQERGHSDALLPRFRDGRPSDSAVAFTDVPVKPVSPKQYGELFVFLYG